MTEVKQGTTGLTTFLYDADGNRVKGTVSGTTTVYIAGIYERQGAAYTSYYEGGGLRRSGYSSNNGVFYMLSDHLKSTSALVARNGVLNVKYFYYPYGARRGVPFNTITAKHFTGQYHETSLPGGEGLSFYNARWYDPRLGRFLSADTIVPNPSNPQDLNRFAYVRNNPLRYVDPSGHMLCEGAVSCSGGGSSSGGSSTGGTGTSTASWTPPPPVYGPAPRPAGGSRGGSGSSFGGNSQQNSTSMWSYWNSTQTGMDLFSDWFHERGSTTRIYGPNAAMTRDLINDEGVQIARLQFYSDPTKEVFYPYHFTQVIQPIREELQHELGLDKSGVGRVLGGYTVYVQPIQNGQDVVGALFVVYNVMGRESFTRLLGHGPSIEGYLRGERPTNAQGARDYWPKSSLDNKSRQEPSLSVIPPSLDGWGGDITTVFIWSEPLQINTQ